MIADNRNKATIIVDIAVPGDFQVREKEMEKITRSMAVPAVIGALVSPVPPQRIAANITYRSEET